MSETGGRWYDNTRVIWGLFVVIGILIGFIVTDLSHTVSEHGSRIGRLEATTEVNHEILKIIQADIREIKQAIKKGP